MLFHSSIRHELARSFGATLVVLVRRTGALRTGLFLAATARSLASALLATAAAWGVGYLLAMAVVGALNGFVAQVTGWMRQFLTV